MSPMPLPSTSTRPAGKRPTTRASVDGDLEAHAVLDDEDPLGGDAHAPGQARVAEQVPVLAVHGQEVARPRQVQHELEIFLAGVAGDVDEGVVLVEDLRPASIEAVDDAPHGALVARNDPRGQDHQIARLDLDVLVLAGGHEGEGRVGLALASRGEDHLIPRGPRRQLVERPHDARGESRR